jgi:SAM-dependent methyltransferase
MRNPWLEIPLEDYEGHMSLPSIGQAQMLAEHFDSLIRQHSPASVAVIGCAGGNGLERIAPGTLDRIVAVDINPGYIAETGIRHSRRLQGLELYCADAASDSMQFAPVDLIYAALLFEYVEAAAVMRSLKRHCRPGGILATVLQSPHAAQQPISPSPYTTLSSLTPRMRLLAPEELCRYAAAAGFVIADAAAIELPSGKRFWAQNFRSSAAMEGEAL